MVLISFACGFLSPLHRITAQYSSTAEEVLLCVSESVGRFPLMFGLHFLSAADWVWCQVTHTHTRNSQNIFKADLSFDSILVQMYLVLKHGDFWEIRPSKSGPKIWGVIRREVKQPPRCHYETSTGMSVISLKRNIFRSAVLTDIMRMFPSMRLFDLNVHVRCNLLELMTLRFAPLCYGPVAAAGTLSHCVVCTCQLFFCLSRFLSSGKSGDVCVKVKRFLVLQQHSVCVFSVLTAVTAMIGD